MDHLQRTKAIGSPVKSIVLYRYKPVLQCGLFKVAKGKLTMVSADDFRLVMVKLDFDGDEGQALINRDELRSVTSALRKVRRV